MDKKDYLKILFVEDLYSDTELARRAIKKENTNFIDQVVDNEVDYKKALENFQPDIIVSDYSMPTFDGMSALEILRSYNYYIPFIILTGSINEETAVECMKAGANDYVIKEHIHRLPMAIMEAIRNYRNKIEKELIQKQLTARENRFRNIMSSMQDIVYTLDREQRFTGVYGSWVERWGFKPEQLIRKTYRETIGDANAEVHEKANEKALKGEFVVYEWFIQTKQGKEYFQTSLSPIFDEEGKVQEVVAVGRDITSRKKAEQKVQKAMDATIETISKIVDTRDPYTSGHQHRVTQLALRIAQELKLSQNQIEAIRIASLIHDIGKIGIPSEILTKPSKLSDLEFSLIKSHPQLGYNILKDIDFPYPISQIVLQHHERLNGSGYPNKLKAEEILLEAKIIGVADVVEAMSSHRPYRAALGIEAALEEIFKNKGILYDSEVVDACIKLFKEKGFNFG